MLSLLLLLSLLITEGSGASTIAFTTLGRSRYAFDIFSASIASSKLTETRLTDGVSVNYNGVFPSSNTLLYVSERNGSHQLLLDFLPSIEQIKPNNHTDSLHYLHHLSINGGFVKTRFDLTPNLSTISMKDRPSLVGETLIYVSTHEPNSLPRQSWAAVYSTHLPTLHTKRLTPYKTADFSPAVSPSGQWTAVASERFWSGEVEDLNTDIFVFKTKDGSERIFVEHLAGWPCWADDFTLFFHKRDESGWWGIYRASFDKNSDVMSVLSIVRVTDPGFHAFTPAVSPGKPGFLAMATRRANSKYRHIELLDLESNSYKEVTKQLKPYSHHYNPFLSPDGSKVGYHRCRGERNGSPILLFETLKTISPDEFSLFRIDGSFPSFSPDGKHIAFVRLPGLYVAKTDGSGIVRKIYEGNAFATCWDPKRTGVIYTSVGPDFASESTEVDIVSISINVNDINSKPVIKKLSNGGDNNAFPSPSPDGQSLVFRSGRTGSKNLYITDAVKGESKSLVRLTDGPWTDTMCSWAPSGEWIAFASDRERPGAGGFSIYVIHPNGTGLRKLVHSGSGGRTNHPWFSPDSQSVVFTSDLAGVSAEPISNPHHYQPYGEIFTVNVDGSGLRRLTHNSYEDGTPTWSGVNLESKDVGEDLEGQGDGEGEIRCDFEDCQWLEVKSGE